jgi:hypothetical protein
MVAIQKTEPETGERGPMIGVTMSWDTAVGMSAILHKVAKHLTAADPNNREAKVLDALSRAYSEACAKALKCQLANELGIAEVDVEIVPK